MRVALSGLILGLTASLAAAQPPASPPPPSPPPTPQPVFRAGVDLLTVDATVVDREGRQVTDLTPADFVVEVDGDARPVVTAEYVKLIDDTPVPIGAPRPKPPGPPADEAFFSTNARSLYPGRLILLLVDAGNIRIGQGRQALRSAAKFVDQLSPLDRVAMVTIPHGALVDFTYEHERIREALLATIGQAQPFKGRFYITLSEAIATVEHSDALLRQQLMQRECGGIFVTAVEAARCEIEVEQEAGEVVNHQRQQTQSSLRGMRTVLQSLAALDGPKSVILISEGLVLEGLSGDVDDVAAIAADVRASLDVMLLDVPAVDVSESQRPATPREDRERQVTGLESLAGLSRGALHRVITTGDSAFQRILRSIAGHYLLAVESRPADRDGRRHRISVKSTRRGTTVYSRRGFLATTSPSATSAADAVAKALRSPLTLNDLSMRVSTWTYKEPGGTRIRLLFTAEIERNTDQPLAYTTGVMLVDGSNKVVAHHVEPRTLRVSEADPARALHAGVVLLEPGKYLLRMAVADSEGRIGSVDRRLAAWHMDAAELTVGDLVIAQAPADPTTPIMPAIEPQVGNGRLAAMMEVYAPDAARLAGLRGTIDVVPNEGAKPLTSAPMQVRPGESPEVGVLQARLNTAALPPGRYLARVSVTENDTPRGHLLRPFRVVAGAAAEGGADAAMLPSVLPPDVVRALMSTLPAADRQDLLAPDVLAAALAAAEQVRPAARSALAAARAGQLGPAALEALAAGDQPIAAFLRGVDFFMKGEDDRAVQQLQIAMQQAPTLAPARLYLGAALAQQERHREAAGLLQSAAAALGGQAAVSRLAAESWLRAGNPELAIATLEPAASGGGADAASGRTLALAYVAGNRAAEALPLLTAHLEAHPTDQEALLAGVYALYTRHLPSPRGETLSADQALAQRWAKAYAGSTGAHQPLVDAWIAYLRGAR